MRSSLWSSALVLGALFASPCFTQTAAPESRPAEAAAPVRGAQTAPPAGGKAAPNVASGEVVFASTCVICHGEDGQGGHGGGAPLAGVTDPAAAIQTIVYGRNQMPAFDGLLSEEQIRDVAAYVVERLSEKAR